MKKSRIKKRRTNMTCSSNICITGIAFYLRIGKFHILVNKYYLVQDQLFKHSTQDSKQIITSKCVKLNKS